MGPRETTEGRIPASQAPFSAPLSSTHEFDCLTSMGQRRSHIPAFSETESNHFFPSFQQRSLLRASSEIQILVWGLVVSAWQHLDSPKRRLWTKWSGKTHPTLSASRAPGSTALSLGWGPGCIKRRKRAEPWHSLCLLRADVTWSALHSLTALPLPCHNGKYPKTMSQNKALRPPGALAGYFVRVTKMITSENMIEECWTQGRQDEVGCWQCLWAQQKVCWVPVSRWERGPGWLRQLWTHCARSNAQTSSHRFPQPGPLCGTLGN